MEEAIRKQVDEDKPENVEELSLDSCSPIDMKLLEPYTKNLKTLSLCENNIQSLVDLPIMDKLMILDLSENQLTGHLMCLTEKCPNITYLDLSENPIENVDELKGLTDLKSLETLRLDGCPVVKQDKYREMIFNMLESLISLDGLNVNGEEVDSSEDEYDDEDDDDDDDESEQSDTHLSVLLGDDIPSELDDSEFKMDTSVVEEAKSSNDKSPIVDDTGVDSNEESLIEKRSSEEMVEKRPLAETITIGNPSPSKKPKVNE